MQHTHCKNFENTNEFSHWDVGLISSFKFRRLFGRKIDLQSPLNDDGCEIFELIGNCQGCQDFQE